MRKSSKRKRKTNRRIRIRIGGIRSRIAGRPRCRCYGGIAINSDSEFDYESTRRICRPKAHMLIRRPVALAIPKSSKSWSPIRDFAVTSSSDSTSKTTTSSSIVPPLICSFSWIQSLDLSINSLRRILFAVRESLNFSKQGERKKKWKQWWIIQCKLSYFKNYETSSLSIVKY